MMDEDELRRRFEQLREADQEHAPSFAQTYGRARSRRSRGATLRVRTLVIGAAASVAIAAVWLARTRSSSPSEPTPTIATWRAPTDVFLPTSGGEVLRAMPALGASVLDTMIPLPLKRGA